MEDAKRSPLRLLAPLALLAFGVLLSLVILSSSGAGGDAGTQGERTAKKPEPPPKKKPAPSRSERRERELPSGAYTVQSGDTLSQIAVKTGLSVERLQELNPQLDPQLLSSGQKINLRE